MEGLKKWIALLATITMLLLALMSGLISAAPSKEWKEDKDEQSSVVEEQAEEGLGGEETAAGPRDEKKNIVDEGEAPEAPDSSGNVAGTVAGGGEEPVPEKLPAVSEPTMSTMASVTPTLVDPWTSGDAESECALAASILGVSPADFAYKVDAAAPNGVYASDGNTITISNSTGKVFDWASVYPVQCVIVKAGTAAYLFHYPGGAYGDTGLYAPDNKDISHVTFCFNEPEERPGSITGYKYEDLDADGELDPGEPGFEGMKINLLTQDEPPVVVDTTVTGADGKFTFSNVEPGTYDLAEYLSSVPGTITKYVTTIYGIEVVSGEETVLDEGCGEYFLNYLMGSISGFKYRDLDADGELDPGEPGFEGVTINLYDAGDNLIDTTVTDANGKFVFTGVEPGTYKIEEVLGAGVFTKILTVITGVVVVSGEETALEQQYFLNYEEGSITGLKFEDMNADGDKDAEDMPWAGITIQLKQGDTVVDTIVTDANGRFTFSGVEPGTYDVVEVLGAGIYTSTSLIISGVVVTSGQAVVLDETPFLNYELGSISGYKYRDLDADGELDPGEPGFEGVTIKLLTQDDPPSEVDITETDGNGGFLFENVMPGTYDIAEVLEEGVFTKVSTVITGVVVVSGEETVLEEDFFLNYELGSISGYKYEDLDADGELDATDTPWDGSATPIVIELWSGGVKIHDTTIDDESGFYIFAGLEPGEYTLKEAEPFPEGVKTEAAKSFTVVIASGEHLVVAPEQYFLNYILEVEPIIIEPEVKPQVQGQLPATGWNMLPLVLAAGALMLLGLLALMLGALRFHRS